MMDDMEQFRYSDSEQSVAQSARSKTPKTSTKPRSVAAFIRGPIPLGWLAQAAKVPRRNAVLVGLVLFYLAGLKKDRNGLVLTVRRCKPVGLERKSVQRGLADLEKSGLIRVTRTAGQSPRVDIFVSETK
ncbi:MAG: hypothetical protein ACK6A7_14565 [Planctomycetota bacterium]